MRRLFLGQEFPQYRLPAPRPGESQNVLDLAKHGAVLEVDIAVPSVVAESYASRGQPIPAPQRVRGLIDSGASISGVKPAVAQAAGLIQTSSVTIAGVVGTQRRPVYTTAIGLPEFGVHFDVIDIAGVELPQEGLDVLIGRDVLSHVNFLYRGTEGNFDIQNGELNSRNLLVTGGILAGVIAALAVAGAFRS